MHKEGGGGGRIYSYKGIEHFLKEGGGGGGQENKKKKKKITTDAQGEGLK